MRGCRRSRGEGLSSLSNTFFLVTTMQIPSDSKELLLQQGFAIPAHERVSEETNKAYREGGVALTATKPFRPFSSRGVLVTNEEIDRMRDDEDV